MPSGWNGEDRRKNGTDHDTLVTIVQLMKNHIDNFNKHVRDDESSFKTLKDQVNRQSVFIYTGLGIVITLQFLIKH